MGELRNFMENDNSKDMLKDSSEKTNATDTQVADNKKDEAETTSDIKKKKFDTKEKASTLHWVPLIIAVLYAVSPVNLILREAQIFGFIEVDWFEDVLFMLVGALHGLQKNILIGKPKQQKIVNLAKWILLGVGIAIIVVMMIIRTE